MLKILTFLFSAIILFPAAVNGQASTPTYDSSFVNSYYEQKVSLFSQLPQSSDDIIFIGNSITDIGEWAELWQNLHVKNRGISSDITFGVLARLREVTKGKPAKIFIMIGINDIARNIPEEVIVANYKKIIEQILKESPGTKVYVQSILPTNNEFMEYKNHQNKSDKIIAVNNELKYLSKALKVTFIDLSAHFSDGEFKLSKKYSNDGLHLNGAGYIKWKSVLEEAQYCCD